MKILYCIFETIISNFFISATPNLFGSKRRREGKRDAANMLIQEAGKTQKDIDALTVQNPFESAAAKSAMAASSRKAKQTQQRFANVMGGNINPESAIAAQQATQEAIAGTAGDIAVGSEAQKKAEMGQLRAMKGNLLAQSTQLKEAAADEWGSGWKDAFTIFQSFKNPFKSQTMNQQ